MPGKFTKRECPIAAQFVADFRSIFGAEEVTVTNVREGETNLGTPWPELLKADVEKREE